LGFSAKAFWLLLSVVAQRDYFQGPSCIISRRWQCCIPFLLGDRDAYDGTVLFEGLITGDCRASAVAVFLLVILIVPIVLFSQSARQPSGSVRPRELVNITSLTLVCFLYLPDVLLASLVQQLKTCHR